MIEEKLLLQFSTAVLGVQVAVEKIDLNEEPIAVGDPCRRHRGLLRIVLGDTASFRETCRSHDIPVAIERSRSGNGAHAWFFFSAPVSSSLARNLGCFLITESVAHRHQISMSSYDRLFPNQEMTLVGLLPRCLISVTLGAGGT